MPNLKSAVLRQPVIAGGARGRVMHSGDCVAKQAVIDCLERDSKRFSVLYISQLFMIVALTAFYTKKGFVSSFNPGSIPPLFHHHAAYAF